MNIFIGITTYNRPKHIDLCEDQICKYTPIEQRDIHIAYDSPQNRLGIAARKNECLIGARDSGADYIFLFDDDTFPIKEGWADLFINASKASGQQHFMYLKETPTIKKINSFSREGCTTDIYNNSAGCMMFFTKEVIEKVGAYNPAYKIYGYEHAGYSNRIHKAGLTPLGSYS